MKIERVEVTYGELRSTVTGNRKVQVTFSASVGDDSPADVEASLIDRAKRFVDSHHKELGGSTGPSYVPPKRGGSGGTRPQNR